MTTYEYQSSTTSVVTSLHNQTSDKGFMELQNRFRAANYFIMPLILVIGILGNSSTVIVMTSKTFKNVTSRYAVISLALSDSVLLLSQPFNKMFVMKILGYDARALSDIGCKTFFVFFRTAKMTSSWLLVILCVERFISIVFPFKRKILVTKKTMLRAIILKYLINGTINSFWSFSSQIVNGICKPDVTSSDTKEKYRNFLITGLSLYSLIPTAILITLTPVVVYKLLRQKSKLHSDTYEQPCGTNRETATGAQDVIKLSFMLIGVVVAYIICVLPITFIFILAFSSNVSVFDTNTVGFYIYREIAQILEQINYACNFYLYVLCSASFRKKAMAMINLSRTSRLHPSVKPSSQPENVS